MKSTYTSFQATYKAALDLEVRKDKTANLVIVVAVTNQAKLTPEEQEAVNPVCAW